MDLKNDACVFCEFLDKETVIYQDELCYAAISLSPINDYHVLIIPYKHYEDFIDLPDSLASHIFIVAKRISKAVRETCNPMVITHLSDDDIQKTGYNLVSHYKFHIIPRFINDDVRIDWGRKPDRGITFRKRIAEKIRANIK